MIRDVKYMVFCLFVLFFTACVEEDYSKISTDYTWAPDLSLPVGYTSFYVPDTIDLPEIGEVPESVVITDTMPYDPVELLRELELVEELMYRLNFENAYPGPIIINAYYLDNDYRLIGEVFADGPITVEGATVDDAGELVTISTLQHDEYLTPEQILQLQEVKYILLETTLTGLTREIYENIHLYHVGIEIGIQVKMEISFIN